MVGMSGGVDSAVSALLLQEQGFAVAGLFMKNWEEDDGTEYCTAEADYADAAAVCERLGIELHTANFAAEYWNNVFEAFLADYRNGRTPNPEVLCNREIKFKLFLDYAELLGFETIATGHYARRSPPGEPFRLFKGTDANKDQSCFCKPCRRRSWRVVYFPWGACTSRQCAKEPAALASTFTTRRTAPASASSANTAGFLLHPWPASRHWHRRPAGPR